MRLFRERNSRISSLFFGLRSFVLLHRPGIEKVPVDLSIQVVPVGDDHKGEVARVFAEDLPHIKDHGEALARALGVPEDAELPRSFISGFKGLR